jgi:hypothetical protein
VPSISPRNPPPPAASTAAAASPRAACSPAAWWRTACASSRCSSAVGTPTCKEFDQAYAALITDLAKSGKLKDTLVVVATEFGRSPEIKAEHKDGRDHHPQAFSCLLAGGGIKGGVKHGLTDASGGKVKEDLVSVQDFNATIAHALALPYDTIVMSPTKRPFKIADKGVPVAALFG